MSPGYNDHQWIAHTLDDACRMHLCETFGSRGESLVSTINFVERQYNCKVKIVVSDNEQALGNKWIAYTREKGIQWITTPRGQPEQNGPIERSGGVIISKSRKLLIDAQIPQPLWPEAVRATVWLLNRSPVKALQWKTPIEMAQILTGTTNPIKPSLASLHLYGCRAYTRIPTPIPRKEKTRPRAYIGILVGFVASNIWRIWNPKLKRVTNARDVNFDETRRYDPNEPFIEDQLSTGMPEPPIELLNVPTTSIFEFHDILDDDVMGLLPPHEAQKIAKINKPENVVEKAAESGRMGQNLGILTPRPTPEPDAKFRTENDESSTADVTEQRPETLHETISTVTHESSTEASTEPDDATSELSASLRNVQDESSVSHPSRQISSEVSITNIIEGKRIRKPSDRRCAYATHLEDSSSDLTGVNMAFSSAILGAPKTRTHLDDSPPPPRTWNELQSHPYKEQFLEATRMEMKTLVSMGTWRKVKRPYRKQVLRVIWVFAYKFDETGFITCFKARLCVRCKLWDLKKNTLLLWLLGSSVLSWHSPRQYDFINAFLNSYLDEEVYIDLPDGYKEHGMALLLLRALYGLRRSPRLWLQEFTNTLLELGLSAIPEEPCLFANDKLIVMFYVDDMIVLYKETNREAADNLECELKDRYALRPMAAAEWFLGIRIIRDRTVKKLWLSQRSYIEKIAHRFHLEQRKTPNVPLPSKQLTAHTEEASTQDIFLYQHLTGSILYPAIITQPDVAKSAGDLARYNKNPGSDHLAAAEWNIGYLNGTKDFAIEYSGSESTMIAPFVCTSDAAFADHPDRKSSLLAGTVTLCQSPLTKALPVYASGNWHDAVALPV